MIKSQSMKKQNKPHFLLMAAIVAVFAAFTVSCNKDDDPSLADLREDKLQYLEDSLRISDSLKRLNQAGIVNYAVAIVDGTNSSMFAHDGEFSGRAQKTQSVLADAIVTIGQFGKTETDTTDASGMVVFNGYFRNAVTVTIRKEGYTTVSYVAGVSINDGTPNGSISSVGNIIPLFATTGPNTSTISGRATIETNLTNRTPELAPDGTTVNASIDAMDYQFYDRYLTYGFGYMAEVDDSEVATFMTGTVLQASYQTGVVGSVTNGNYTITVPASADGLPLTLEYSDVAADQTLFQLNGADQNVITTRTVFEPYFFGAATLPASSNVSVGFESYDVQATATAVISAQAGTIEKINVTNGGSGYIAATPPLVQINGDGTGATATATVGANGKVTGVTITNAGTGYTTVSSVAFLSGTGATATAGLQTNGTVTSIVVTNSGSGYTTAPTVTIPAPGGTGTQATGTANIDPLGRVTSITITNPGSGYSADPGAITISAPPAGGVQAVANALYSGVSVGNVTVTPGSGYTYAPTVTFSAPQRANGVRAAGTATVDVTTGQVTGILVTNAGSGYTSAPTITLNAGSGATAQAFLTGGSVISFNITNAGDDYAYAPTVVIGRTEDGNGSGAAGTVVMSNGRVVGINITNGGSGYTSAPSVELVSGSGAVAYALVNGSGSITGFNITKGGAGYTGAPRVILNGGGNPPASATATVAGGAITGLTVVLGGSGYTSGNIPAVAQPFSATKGTYIYTKPGIKYINDIHYGTGTVRN
jgi:hypothetical protein